MNNPQELHAALQTRFPGFAFMLDAAETASGSSWINIADQTIAIEFRPGTGLGLFLDDDTGYGSRPDEVYRDPELLLKRLGQLLAPSHSSVQHATGVAGSGPLAATARKQITLKDIREVLGLTQTEVAKALDTQQSAISKLEKRDDVLVSTLVALIHGLNGTVEIKAKFEGCDVSIYAD